MAPAELVFLKIHFLKKYGVKRRSWPLLGCSLAALGQERVHVHARAHTHTNIEEKPDSAVNGKRRFNTLLVITKRFGMFVFVLCFKKKISVVQGLSKDNEKLMFINF